MNCFFIIAGVNTVAVVSAFLFFTLKIVKLAQINYISRNFDFWLDV